jgi:SAM-dependent methyltransferase
MSDLQAADTAALLNELRRRAEHDPAAMAALAELGTTVAPGALGLKDAILSGWYDRDAGELVPGFAVGSADTVLDVGCGDGGTLTFCAELGAGLILADIDPEKVAQARAWLSGNQAAILSSHVTDANPLPLADRTASRVICTEVLEHVDNPAAVMAELARVGQPGALYLLSVPDPVQEGLQKHLADPVYFQKPNHQHVFSRDEFAALVTQAGLQIERRSYKGFFWAIWWLLFWPCGVPVEQAAKHPVLNNWARTWASLLGTPNGLKTKLLLDRFLPHSQVIVARKK